MGTIQEFLAKYQDERLARHEHLMKSLSDFQAEAAEIDDLLPALIGTDACRDDEVQHYLKYFKAAIHRFEQRQMCSDVDDALAWHLKRARQEGS